MPLVKWTDHPPPLQRPTLVAAFQGWNDAGEAASGALAALAEGLHASPCAELDAEEFFDFQVNRPTLRWRDGQRRIEWPATTFSWAAPPGGGHVVFLEGVEPNLRWRTFTDEVLAVARDLGVQQVMTIGALQVDVPHTRPVPLTGASSSPEIAERHGLRRSTYEGPTGIVGVLHAAASDAGLDAVSLWAGAPHYLAATSYLSAALALAERAVAILGVEVPLDDLARDAAAQLDDIAELVAEDEDLAGYVAELERRADERGDPLDADELPTPPVSGEQLAAEFERYLRDRHGGDG